MQITTIRLRNYRAYEALDLDLPPGLVGIYGPNGSGKTTLLEAITWALYGRARTQKDEIRTTGTNAECVAEIHFTHDDHHYVVRRTISGVNATVRAEAHADGAQMTEGARDTDKYVRSVLGMDESAFRASVFAEQKQLDAFSDKRPAERQKLVLRLLGITPLDAARDEARRDSKARRTEYERLRDVLPDLDDLRAQGRAAAVAANDAAAKAADAERDAEAADAIVLAARTRHDDLVARRRDHDALVAEGKSVRAEHDRAAARVADLAAELDGLRGAETELAALEPVVAGLGGVEERLRHVDAVERAQAALARIPPAPEPEALPEDAAEAARAAAEAVQRARAEAGALLAAAVDQLERARAQLGRAADLSGEADCPLCGQELGDRFEAVRRHRAEEVAAAEGAVAERRRVVRDLDEQASAAMAAAEREAARLAAARAAWGEYDRAATQRRVAEAALAEALAAAGDAPADGEAAALRADVERCRAAAARIHTLRGRLERRQRAAAELAAETEHQRSTADRLEILREKVRALAFTPEDLAAAEGALAGATSAATLARRAAAEAGAAQAAARERAAQLDARLREATEQHDRLGTLAEESRYLGRLADLLHGFRNTLVGAAGPILSNQANEVFAALTDHRYDRLEVDPETYEIQIRDEGRLHDMDRFSGSETDLANLALRVAISEHVRFRSGGQVGLLVLDEVFGSLDDDRRVRLLSMLERLRGRFRQILVVTHSPDVKEQLPQAIEVRRTGDGRATATQLV